MEQLGVVVVKELGRGTSGIVYKVQHQADGRYYVVKTIDLSSISNNKQKKSEKEVEILSTVSHPHIIRYYNSIIKNETLYILMEYASGGDLQTCISKAKEKRHSIDESQLWTWAYEICLGVHHLHSHHILHRDIKCMNIFLDGEKRIKIGDLGLSKMTRTKQMHTSIVGTPLYLSPEQIRRHPYGNKADIWAVGCVLYAVAALDLPFLGDNIITLGYNIINKSPRALPARYSPKLVTFILKFLDKNSYKRPEIKEVLGEIPLFIKKLYRKPALPPDPASAKVENSLLSTSANDSIKIQPETVIITRNQSQPPESSFRSHLKMQIVPENIVSSIRPMTTAANHRSYLSIARDLRPDTSHYVNKSVLIVTPKPEINEDLVEVPLKPITSLPRPDTSGENISRRSYFNLTAPVRPDTSETPCRFIIRPRATIKDLAKIL